MLYSKVDPKEHNCNVSSSLLSFTSSTVPNLLAWFTQLWANHCHLQQLCLCIIQRGEKQIQKNFVSVLCPYPAASFETQYYPTQFVVQTWTEVWVSLIWIISAFIQDALSSSQWYTPLFQAKHQSRDTRDLDHRSPMGSSLPPTPQKKKKRKKGN